MYFIHYSCCKHIGYVWRGIKTNPRPKNSTAPGPRPPVLKFLDPPLSMGCIQSINNNIRLVCEIFLPGMTNKTQNPETKRIALGLWFTIFFSLSDATCITYFPCQSRSSFLCFFLILVIWAYFFKSGYTDWP